MGEEYSKKNVRSWKIKYKKKELIKKITTYILPRLGELHHCEGNLGGRRRRRRRATRLRLADDVEVSRNKKMENLSVNRAEGP